MRQRIAISCARSIFLIVSGHHDPALTVASFATTTTWRPRDARDSGDDAGGGRLAVVLVVRDEQADLEEAGVGIAKTLDALAGGELSLRVLASNLLRSAALSEPCLELSDFRAELAKSRGRHASCPSRSSRSANHSLM